MQPPASPSAGPGRLGSADPLDPSGDVSVVVVAYRTPEVVAACLRSFELHRPRRVGQVVVVDNGPPEERGWAAPFPWIDYAPNDANVHFRRGVNQGVRLARARYVLVLNPDTALTDPDSVARLAAVLDAEPAIGLVGPKLRGDDGLLAPQGERAPGLAYLLAHMTYVNALWPGNPLAGGRTPTQASLEKPRRVESLSGAAFLCRRDEFLAVGGLDERAAAYWEEHELALKLRRHGRGAYYLPSSFFVHRWRKGGSEHEAPATTRRHFDEAMRVYYGHAYGRAGLVAFDVLARLRRVLRRTAGRR